MNPAAWKRELKERLRDIVVSPEFGGSQRKLAAAWLGDASKSPQVSEWCSETRKVVPGAYNLHLLRKRCDIDLNRLVCGSGAPPKPGNVGVGWTAARRRKLADELVEYGWKVILESVGTRKRVRSVDPDRESVIFEAAKTASFAWSAIGGDFLGFFSSELRRVTDLMRCVDQEMRFSAPRRLGNSGTVARSADGRLSRGIARRGGAPRRSGSRRGHPSP